MRTLNLAPSEPAAWHAVSPESEGATHRMLWLLCPAIV